MKKIEKVADLGEFYTVNDLIEFLTDIKEKGLGDNFLCRVNDNDEVSLLDHIQMFVEITDDDLVAYENPSCEALFDKTGLGPVVLDMF